MLIVAALKCLLVKERIKWYVRNSKCNLCDNVLASMLHNVLVYVCGFYDNVPAYYKMCWCVYVCVYLINSRIFSTQIRLC